MSAKNSRDVTQWRFSKLPPKTQTTSKNFSPRSPPNWRWKRWRPGSSMRTPTERTSTQTSTWGGAVQSPSSRTAVVRGRDCVGVQSAYYWRLWGSGCLRYLGNFYSRLYLFIISKYFFNSWCRILFIFLCKLAVGVGMKFTQTLPVSFVSKGGHFFGPPFHLSWRATELFFGSPRSSF